jgi:hypothetical protein
MKIFFLRPNDTVILQADGYFPKTLARWKKEAKDGDWSDNEDLVKAKFTFFPKGTEITVSQVYIRNRGWYDSNINFKLSKNIGIPALKGISSIRIDLEDIETWDVELKDPATKPPKKKRYVYHSNYCFSRDVGMFKSGGTHIREWVKGVAYIGVKGQNFVIPELCGKNLSGELWGGDVTKVDLDNPDVIRGICPKCLAIYKALPKEKQRTREVR